MYFERPDWSKTFCFVQQSSRPLLKAHSDSLFTNFSCVLPSRVGYYAGKPIESALWCFNKTRMGSKWVAISACLSTTHKSSLWLSIGALDHKTLRFEILFKEIFYSKGAVRYLSVNILLSAPYRQTIGSHLCHTGLSVNNSFNIPFFF